VLHTFTGGRDGDYPYAGLVMDAAGNPYGTTFGGGQGGGDNGQGVVFEVDQGRTETVLHTFSGGTGGRRPKAGLIRGQQGVLYGATQTGGSEGNGVIFELVP
jgi:uncharacterized repeat protein (TIGR03803 family)